MKKSKRVLHCDKTLQTFENTQEVCCSRKYPYPSHGRFFSLNPHPLWKFHSSAILSFTNWAFETPLSLGISINLPWGGYGYFLELHSVQNTPLRLVRVVYVSLMFSNARCVFSQCNTRLKNKVNVKLKIMNTKKTANKSGGFNLLTFVLGFMIYS